MSFGPVVDELIESLKILPGVGQKSAQRMALMLLDGERRGSARLVNALGNAIEKVGQCSACRTISEFDVYRICLDENRDRQVLCVIESPADLIAIEQAHYFVVFLNTIYFLTMGFFYARF